MTMRAYGIFIVATSIIAAASYFVVGALLRRSINRRAIHLNALQLWLRISVVVIVNT